MESARLFIQDYSRAADTARAAIDDQLNLLAPGTAAVGRPPQYYVPVTGVQPRLSPLGKCQHCPALGYYQLRDTELPISQLSRSIDIHLEQSTILSPHTESVAKESNGKTEQAFALVLLLVNKNEIVKALSGN